MQGLDSAGWYRQNCDTYVEQRQPPVCKSRDQVAHDSDGEENEVDLVVGSVEDASLSALSIRDTEDVDASDEEKRGTEVDCKGDGDVSEEV